MWASECFVNGVNNPWAMSRIARTGSGQPIMTSERLRADPGPRPGSALIVVGRHVPFEISPAIADDEGAGAFRNRSLTFERYPLWQGPNRVLAEIEPADVPRPPS